MPWASHHPQNLVMRQMPSFYIDIETDGRERPSASSTVKPPALSGRRYADDE